MPAHFDAEGKLILNVAPVPKENPVTEIVSHTLVARYFDDWGMDQEADTSQSDKVNAALKRVRVFTDIDRGNLMRIAIASEKTVREVRAISRTISRLTTELKEMAKFWSGIEEEYRRQKSDVAEKD